MQAFLCPHLVGFCFIGKVVPIQLGSRKKCHVGLLGSRKPAYHREKREDTHGREWCLEGRRPVMAGQLQDPERRGGW